MYSCNGQKAVGQSNFFSLSSFSSRFVHHFTSLDDFIDARLGRKPANVHIHHLFDSAPNSAPTSSSTTTTTSAPPDSPTLITTQTLMSEGGAAPITPTQQHTHLTSKIEQRERGDAPQQSMQDPLSRSARIRAFRAFQHATPEEKERMRGNWVGGGAAGAGGGTDGDNSAAAAAARRRGGGGGEWTAVHLLSADEVKSLFKDVVEGLRFLVLTFLFSFFFSSVFCFIAGLSNLWCVAFFL